MSRNQSCLLYGRNFYATFKAIISVLFAIMRGVLRGGVCSAILFNIFVRNLPLVILFANLFQYCDDCSLKKFIYSSDDQKLLQSDLNTIQKWSNQNKLKLNASKSAHLIFTKRKTLKIDYYVINNEEIPTETTDKHLGIIFDNQFSFSGQNNVVVNNCLKMVFF
jgi:hypothetical protein